MSVHIERHQKWYSKKGLETRQSINKTKMSLKERGSEAKKKESQMQRKRQKGWGRRKSQTDVREEDTWRPERVKPAKKTLMEVSTTSCVVKSWRACLVLIPSPWQHCQQKRRRRERVVRKRKDKKRQRIWEWGYKLWEIVSLLCEKVCVCETKFRKRYPCVCQPCCCGIRVSTVRKLISVSVTVCVTGTEGSFTAIIKAFNLSGQDWIGR